MVPDCDGRNHKTAKYLKSLVEKGEEDVRILLNVQGGAIATALTASQVMFEMVEAVIENVPGNNVVTTVLEHPSSYDSTEIFARQTKKELRVAPSNPETGGCDADAVCSLVDKDTCLLMSCMRRI